MATIRKVIDTLDPSKEQEALIKEQLETLAQLAESRAQVDESQIIINLKDGKTTDDLRVPITKVIDSRKEYRVVVQETSSEIIEKIAESIKGMFQGKDEIINSIAQLVGTALDAILGSGEGMEGKHEVYTVAVEYPAIIRFDFRMWIRNTRAQGIKTRCKSALAVVAYKSAVDIEKIDFNTFISIYGPLLAKAFGNDPKELDKMIDKAKEIYDKFRPEPLRLDSLDIKNLINKYSDKMYFGNKEVYEATEGDF